jgi:Tfp pilus assembly protein PilV
LGRRAARELVPPLRSPSAALKADGFSLVEVLVATAVVMVGVASLAQLVVVSAHASRLAVTTSMTVLLAGEKMEALLGESAWIPSPPAALSTSMPGFVDYLDSRGTSLGVTSITPPLETAYIRRWSIESLGDSPAPATVFQVLVIPWPSAFRQTRLVDVKTLKAT